MSKSDFYCEKVIEVSLFLLLLIFPFFYIDIEGKHFGILIVSILFLPFLFIKKLLDFLKVETWQFLLPALFMYIWNFEIQLFLDVQNAYQDFLSYKESYLANVTCADASFRSYQKQLEIYRVGQSSIIELNLENQRNIKAQAEKNTS